MAVFRAFTHVERLDETKIDVSAFLNGTCYIFAKQDGTNFCAWSNNGEIHCGSRKREITIDHDNAESMFFFTTDDRYEGLRNYLLNHEEYILYGEYLGGEAGRKMTGTIKQYLNAGLQVFAIWDTVNNRYLAYEEYADDLNSVFDGVVPPLAILDKPNYEDILTLLDNHYNLPDDTHAEGVVIYNYNYRDNFGHCVIAKIVAKEYLEKKGTSQKVRIPQTREGLEHDIVVAFISSADCEKCKQKIMVAESLDEWENTGKYIGMFLNMLFTDLITEEMFSIIRRFKTPVIDFAVLKNECFIVGRKYLGLI